MVEPQAAEGREPVRSPSEAGRGAPQSASPGALIDGAAVAERLRGRVAADIAAAQAQGAPPPGLAVVLVGEDPASRVYVASKQKRAAEIGMSSIERRLPADTDEPTLLSVVDALNADPAVHGVLVQLPLPAHLDAARVIERIRPEKDVDGFHPINVGRLAAGLPALTPCTPLGCLLLLKETLGDLSGAEAVVVGRSNIVGKPMAQLLLGENCTVTIAHSRTRDIAAVAARADILVAAVGKPRFVQGDWIKPGAVVIDVGINRVPAPELAPKPDGAPRTRLVGDVDFDAAVGRARAITPVPGGVGPMTIACLLANTLEAHRRALAAV